MHSCLLCDFRLFILSDAALFGFWFCVLVFDILISGLVHREDIFPKDRVCGYNKNILSALSIYTIVTLTQQFEQQQRIPTLPAHWRSDESKPRISCAYQQLM